MNDPFGQAIKEFYTTGTAADIVVHSNYTENESIPVAYLFRNEKEMPELEKVALKKCKGKILDVGAAAGCHSLLLQRKGYDVTALEISKLAVEVMKKKGITNVEHKDIFQYKNEKYDTILLLMNGAGIGKTVDGLKELLLHLKTLLTEGGQILMDSSDIKYLFEEEDGSMWVDINNKSYYGEMVYDVHYKEMQSRFNWLFIDFQRLSVIARKSGLRCKLIARGEHHDYLAQLKV